MELTRDEFVNNVNILAIIATLVCSIRWKQGILEKNYLILTGKRNSSLPSTGGRLDAPFICLFFLFYAILLHQAPVNMTSVLLLFVIF